MITRQQCIQWDQENPFAACQQNFTICASYSGMLQISPEDSQQRGSHLSWQHPKAHYIVAALMARGVVVDFYNTDILRIGLSPLYLNFEQLWCVVQHLVEIVQFELRDQPFMFNYAV